MKLPDFYHLSSLTAVKMNATSISICVIRFFSKNKLILRRTCFRYLRLSLYCNNKELIKVEKNLHQTNVIVFAIVLNIKQKPNFIFLPPSLPQLVMTNNKDYYNVCPHTSEIMASVLNKYLMHQLRFVKCHHGGWKIRLIPSIFGRHLISLVSS